MLSALALVLFSGGSDAAALERALASVKPAAIRSDLFFIASDELEGRDTPSPGQRLAARFIRARLERLGWQPMGELAADGTRSFFDEYRLTSTGLDPAASGLEIVRGGAQRVLAPGEDYYFWGDIQDQELAGGVVYVGVGAKADYEGKSLAGSWALVTMNETVNWRERSKNAAESGALGLLVAPDPKSTEAEWWRGS